MKWNNQTALYKLREKIKRKVTFLFMKRRKPAYDSGSILLRTDFDVCNFYDKFIQITSPNSF